MVNTLSMATQPITMVHSHAGYGLWTAVEGHPFAWVAYLWIWGVSFNLTLGLKEGILPTSLSPALSLKSWGF